jgi:hypothetical protein
MISRAMCGRLAAFCEMMLMLTLMMVLMMILLSRIHQNIATPAITPRFSYELAALHSPFDAGEHPNLYDIFQASPSIRCPVILFHQHYPKP